MHRLWDSLHFALALFDNNFNYLSRKIWLEMNSTYDWSTTSLDSDGFYMSDEYKDLDLNNIYGKIRRVDNNLDEKWEMN